MMNTVFYISAAVAVVCTLMVIVTLNVVHSLLYLVVSFLSVALIFFVLGAPFAAALEVIIYAGAIMVLFVFAVMLLNVGGVQSHERGLLSPLVWVGPSVLALILVVELAYVLSGPGAGAVPAAAVPPKQVGIALFGPYLLAVELASFLLLAGLVGAYHIGRRLRPSEPRSGEGV